MQFGTIFYYTRRVIDTGFDELGLLKPGASGPFRGDVCRVSLRDARSASRSSGLPPCPDGLDRTLQLTWLTAVSQKSPYFTARQNH